MNKYGFNDMQNKVASTYTHVPNASMKNVANEFVHVEGDSIEDKVANITVSNDGSWQKRGYSLLNRVVTVIASNPGKCDGFCVLIKTCYPCTSWEKRKNNEPELHEHFTETRLSNKS